MGFFMSIRIFLIDDHPIVREGMERLIDREKDLEVCGDADGGHGTLSMVEKASPDVIVLDLSLQQGNGLDLIHDLKLRLPQTAILILSMHDETIYAERSLRAGAAGYIMKQASPKNVLVAIRRVAAGQVYVSEAMSKNLLKGLVKPAPESAIDTLSDREFQVFQYIGEGRSNHQIADLLNLSVKTIESHIERIKTKLNVRSGRELLRRAMEWVLRQQGPVGRTTKRTSR